MVILPYHLTHTEYVSASNVSALIAHSSTIHIQGVYTPEKHLTYQL